MQTSPLADLARTCSGVGDALAEYRLPHYIHARDRKRERLNENAVRQVRVSCHTAHKTTQFRV